MIQFETYGKINVTLNIKIVSLPSRVVLFTATLINHDVQEYYFNGNIMTTGYWSVNNTRSSRNTDLEWSGCGSGVAEVPGECWEKLPASGGIYQYRVNLVSLCSFLLDEPLGYEHWARYTRSSVNFYDSKSSETSLGWLEITDIRHPFILIDNEKESIDELVEHARYCGRQLAKVEEAESAPPEHSAFTDAFHYVVDKLSGICPPWSCGS